MKNLLLIILVSFKITTIQAQIPSEEFDKAKMEYKGTKSAQARMLMRHIEIWGK